MKKSFIYIFLIAASLIISIYLSNVILSNPYIGIDVKQNSEQQWVVTDSHGLAKDLGIRKGDVVVQINNSPPIEHWTVAKYSSVERAHSLVISDGESFITYTITRNQGNTILLSHFIFPVAFMMLMIILSIILFRSKEKEKPSLIVTFFLLSYGLGSLASGASARADLVGKIIVVGALLYLPVVLLHFLHTYFKQHQIHFCSSKLFLILYGWNTMILLSQCLFLVVDLGNYYSILRMIELLTFLVTFVICLFYYIKGYIQYKNGDYKPIFQLIALGLIVSFVPMIILHIIPMVLNYQSIINGDVAGLFIFALPLTLFYLISTEELFDIDFFISRLAYYAFISLGTTPLFLWVISLFKLQLSMSEIVQLFMIIYFTSIFILYLKEESDYLFRQKLFFERHNYQSTLYQFVSYLSNSVKKAEIETHILNEIKSVFKVNNANIVEYDINKQTFSTTVHSDITSYIHALSKQRLPIGELKFIGQTYVSIIGGNMEKVYLLLLTGKRNRTKFNKNEREWLKTISYLINLSFENLQLVEELIQQIEYLRDKKTAPPWVLRLLFNIQEQERKKFSTDIHDSALQTQLFWYRKLETFYDEHKLTKTQKKELEEIKEGFMDVIYEIRQTCDEMMPPFLIEFGLRKALLDLVNKAQMRNLFIVDLDTTRLQDNLDNEYFLLFYRIIQELLNNAAKHSKADRIQIQLENIKNTICLNYSDNGIGFNINEVTENHFGLSGIYERVKSVEGQIELDSEIGQGVKVKIIIPFDNHLREEVGKDDKSIAGR
ncbi:MAG TPA: hypothetical protein GX497_11165 [Bacillus bacterium]|nr:hypothetical protein [Bacillus sp. (in: firmicutes)]